MGLTRSSQPTTSAARPAVDPVAAAARAHVRMLGRRYAAVALGAGFLAMIVTYFPSTAPALSSIGTAPSPVAGVAGRSTADHPGAPGAAGTHPSTGLLAANGGSDGVFGTGFASGPAGSGLAGTTAPNGVSSDEGALGPFGSAPGSTAAGGGLAPAPIKPASGGSSAPTCPLPPLSIPDAGQVPQAESLLAAATGLCAVLTTVPALVPELPSILTELPTALAHGTLPGPLDQLIQALAFDVVIPLVSVLPLPATVPTQFPTERFTQTLAWRPGEDDPFIGTWPGSGTATDLGDAWQRAGRWATGVTVTLTQPAVPSAQLIGALERAAEAKVPVTVVLGPAATAAGDRGGFAAWLVRTARAVPAGVTTVVDARREGTAPSSGRLASPADLVRDLQVLRNALGAEATVGLSLPAAAPLPGTAWWRELGMALPAEPPGGQVVDLVADTISGAAGCSALGALTTDVAAAGLGAVPEVVTVGPVSGGPTALAAGRTCSVALAHLPATRPLLLQQGLLSGAWRA